MEEYTVRYNVPTRYDSAPFGTILKVMADSGNYNLYIQISRDPDNIIWERSGMFFEKIFNDKLSDPEVLDSWLSKLP